MNDAQRKQVKDQRQAEIEDFQWVMSDSRGRRVMRRVLEQAGIYQLSYAGENTHCTAFNEGRRNVGLFVNDEILAICPEKWVETMKGSN